MEALLNDPLLHAFIQDFTRQQITPATGLAWLLIGIAFSIVGGAIGGIALAGKELGPRLSAMIGGLYGPAAAIPALLLGLSLIGLRVIA